MATDPGLRRLALGTLLGAFPGERAPQWAVDLLAMIMILCGEGRDGESSSQDRGHKLPSLHTSPPLRSRDAAGMRNRGDGEVTPVELDHTMRRTSVTTIV